MPEAAINALGRPNSCCPISAPRLLSSSVRTRVTIIPAVMEINSAGICETNPSPIVKIEYSCKASPAAMPRCVIPIIKPPKILTTMIIMPAIASPLTNFIAPSIAPYNWLSRSNLERRERASAKVITPARKSLSMLICLPGMASNEKRALTSAIRSEPLVMTIN